MDIYNKRFVPLATTYFMTFCRYYGDITDYFFNIYAVNEIVKLVTDMACLTSNHLYCVLIGQKTEPSSVPWVSTMWMKSYPDRVTQRLQLSENYIDDYASIIKSDIFEKAEHANFYFSKISKNFMEDQLNPLVIFKTELSEEESRGLESSEGYIVRRGGYTYDNLSFERSNTKFISIEYTHPDITIPIGLTLDKSWLFVGNEIFSSTFVLRMLQYQPTMHFFDEDYVVKIMDDSCKIFTITSEEYILLTKDGYEIKHIDEYTVIDELIETVDKE